MFRYKNTCVCSNLICEMVSLLERTICFSPSLIVQGEGMNFSEMEECLCLLCRPTVQTFHCSNFPKWALHIHLYLSPPRWTLNIYILQIRWYLDFKTCWIFPPLSCGRFPIYLAGEQFTCLGSFRICLHWKPQYICPNKYPPKSDTNMYIIWSFENTFQTFFWHWDFSLE